MHTQNPGRPRGARPVPRPHPERELKRGATPPRRDHQDRQHARTPALDRSRLAPTPTPSRMSATLERRRQRASPQPCKPKPTAAPAGSTGRWHALESTRQAPLDRRGRRRTRARRTLLGDRDDGVATHQNGSARRAHRRNGREERPERTLRAAPPPGHARRQRTAQLLISHTRSCGTNPRI